MEATILLIDCNVANFSARQISPDCTRTSKDELQCGYPMAELNFQVDIALQKGAAAPLY